MMKNSMLSYAVVLGYFLFTAECAHFEFSDGQQTCILLDLEATFDLSMGTQKADPFDIDGANVTSTSSLCGSDTSSAILSLSLFPTGESFRVNFRRDINLQTVSMSVVLMLEPMKHFENASEILPFELEDSDDLPIGLINMSYKCNSEKQLFFDQDPGYSMTMKITNLQVQAYNVDEGKYSEAIECNQETTVMSEATTSNVPDTTPETPTIGPETTSETPETGPTTSSAEPDTTSPTVTESTTSSEPTKPPKYEIKDGDIVCIVLQGRIKLNINYEKNDGQAVQTILVPNDAKPEGTCSVGGDNKTQEFKLKFFNDTWSFSIEIAEGEPTLLRKPLLRSLEETPSYSWKTLQLTYVIDNQFTEPKESDIGQEKTVTKDEGDGYFKTDAQGSYKCESGERLELSKNVSMDFGDFQYRAFGQDSSGNFTNNDVSKCPADTDDDDDDDNTVAIVLGSVFGGLALILLIGVGIYCYQKSKYKDYEVM